MTKKNDAEARRKPVVRQDGMISVMLVCDERVISARKCKVDEAAMIAVMDGFAIELAGVECKFNNSYTTWNFDKRILTIEVEEARAEWA